MLTLQIIEWLFKRGVDMIKWVVKNPDLLLKGWLAVWGVMLSMMFTSQGLMPTIQFSMTSLFNIGSIFGLPIPIFAMLLVLLKSLASILKDWVLDGIMTLVNIIKKKMMQVGEKTKKAFNKVKNKFKKLKIAESDMYLGLDVDLAERQDEFMQAANEFMYLMKLEGYNTDFL